MRESRAIDSPARVASDLPAVKPTNKEEEKAPEEYGLALIDEAEAGVERAKAVVEEEAEIILINDVDRSTMAGGAAVFLAELGVSSVEILDRSTMAGGAADFSAELGVSSTIKSVVGLYEGLAVGESMVGLDEGLVVGAVVVGLDEGFAVGDSVVGLYKGLAVGAAAVGLDEGRTAGGAAVGESLGFDEGLVVGESVGFDLGIPVGESVGFDQGIAVGEGLAVDEDSSSDSSSPSSSSDDDSSSSSLDFYDQHKDYCEVCGQPGFLLCCATCNIVSHLHCVGLQEEPLNDWMCEYCLADDMKKKDGKEWHKATADRKSPPELEHPFKTISANPKLANKLVVIAK